MALIWPSLPVLHHSGMANVQATSGQPPQDEIKKSEPDTEEAQDQAPDQPDVIDPFGNVPAETKTVIQQALAMVSGPLRSPFWDSFGPQHMTAFIKSQTEESERAHIDRNRDRILQFAVLLVVIAAVFGTLVFAVMAEARELLPTVVIGVLAFGSGYAAGGRSRN